MRNETYPTNAMVVETNGTWGCGFWYQLFNAFGKSAIFWFGCKRWIYKLLENLYIPDKQVYWKFQVSIAQAVEIGSSNDTSNATRKWASHYLWSSREVPSHASHGHTSQVIMEITLNMFKVHLFLLSPLKFLYFKRFSAKYTMDVVVYDGMYPYHRERPNTCRYSSSCSNRYVHTIQGYF